MKNFLRVIAFCSLLNVKLILSAAKEILKIEIKYSKVGFRNSLKAADSIEILGSKIKESSTIEIQSDDSLGDILGMNSLQLLNQILNSDLIKSKVLVNHNWNREGLNTVLRNCPHIQEIKRSLFLINYFNKKNNQKDLFQKTIESCSFFLDTLSRDLASVLNDNSNINKSTKNLYKNIVQETNKPQMPFYFRYPFFGYYYIKFIELFTSLKNYTISKVFRTSSTDNTHIHLPNDYYKE